MEFIFQNKKKFIENDFKLRECLAKQIPNAAETEIVCEFNESILETVEQIDEEVLEEEPIVQEIDHILNENFLEEVITDSEVLEESGEEPNISDTIPKEVEDIPKRKDNVCYLCKERFPSSVKLSEHLPVHLNQIPYKCFECVQANVVIKTLSSLNLHLKMHQMPIKCQFCDNRYSTTNARRAHETSFHLNKKKRPIKCEICGKECPSERSHKEHQKIHNNEHQCKVCQKSFMSSTVLKRHEILHSGEKPFECTICGQKFNHSSNYKTHLKRHTNEKPHECNFCPATFLVSNYLKDHIRIHHGENEFVPKRNLTDQYTCTVYPEESNRREYKCNTCSKVFPSSTHITHHLKTHNKAHQCSHCGRRFKDSRALADHENTHTGSKPHLCKTCGKAFANSSNLYQHNKIHSGVKNQVCHICNKAFTYRENLKTHIRVHHSTEKPYDCIICGEKFIDNVSLKKHKEIHTEILGFDDKS